ncbi:vacuolar alkaline phosphatase [Cladophialophora chaetospira]|uniref:Alkaline phosphatase n=1 Tax=Cladophialophora chaetospira TaxID=386627 RepID=A0AA38XNZ5_9EURO|nr:vacuolar alkaline phosphatase [Cladophialophora chaetospira]
MARDEPLLARPASPNSSTNDIEEEDALLTGQPTNRSPVNRSRRWTEIGLFVWALLATIAVIILAVVYQHETSTAHARPRTGGWGPDGKPSGKRNMIFMVSDGMGPTSLSMTRSWRQYASGLPIDDVLILDKHHIGNSRTRSSSSLVTDSAAGATAFSCGFKSYNGAISVLPDHTPCGTVLEAAKKAGYMTGLVVTTRITDATPACFAAHANRREYEDLIAEQMVGEYPLGRVVDLLIGGGRCHFLPNTTEESCRVDSKDIVALAKDKYGFTYVDNRKDFDDLDPNGVKLPLLALIARTDVPYEIDRVHVADVYPSQAEMAHFALKALSAATQDSDKGFFLMVEGSRIDHAGHANDPGAQVREVMAHDKAFGEVLDFLDADDTEGVLVSTSDHETGGLAAARQLHEAYPIYRWFPEVLDNATHSTEYLNHEWAEYLSSASSPVSRNDQASKLRELIISGLGITDTTDEEIDAIIDAKPTWPPFYILSDMISRRSQIGWSTHGHSAVDVNIYASHPSHAPGLVGNHENIEVGKFIAEYLDVDLEPVTKELRSKKVKTQGAGEGEEWGEWMGPEGLPVNGDGSLVTVDAYHGDFKHRKREVEECGCGARH